MKFMMLFQWQFLYNNMRVYKRSMEYHEPLPSPYETVFFFGTTPPSYGGYIICEVSPPGLYRSTLFFCLFLK